jgi:glycosyltransferase involved in cell wall biosynthesis
MNSSQKRVFISWTQFDTWTDSLAHHLNACCYHIHFPQLYKYRLSLAPVRYLLTAIKTIEILFKERPDIILVQNPPHFAIAVVWLFCVFFSKARFVTDSHSGAFNMRPWKDLLWLYRLVAKQAVANVVHNESMAHEVTLQGVPAVITLHNMPFHLVETDREFPLRDGFNVVFVCTFAPDEPIDEVIKAANNLPDVNFYITGNLKHSARDLTSGISSNIIFTDFLPDKDYVSLLKKCNIVMALTTRDMTMSNGAYEALELGKPIITSDWPVLRKTYTKGAVLIDNSPESLVTAITQIRNRYSQFISEISVLREESHAIWNNSFSRLLANLEQVQK